MDIIKILQAGMEAEEENNNPLPSEKEQTKRLTNFIERKIDFKVGERVVRNEDGESRYRYPRKTQVALVTSVFDKPMLDDDGRVVHGEICMMSNRGKDQVTYIYPVDFRYYKRRPSLA